MWQSNVPSLDWARARNKFGAFIFEPGVRYLGINIRIEDQTCDIVATFRRPSVIRRPGIVSLALRPWCDTRDKVRSCEIRRVLNVEPLLLIERTQLR